MHGSFSDYPFLAAGDDPQKSKAATHNFELITTLVRAFLDKTLNHDKGTLFDTHHPAIPEAEIVPYGD